MTRLLAFFLLFLLFTPFVLAQDRATTEDGRVVILHPDMTWEFAPTDSDGANVRVFFGNLHSHTSYSDGRATPEVAYAHARDVAGLDFLAITEHNHESVAAPNIGLNHELYSGSAPTSLISSAERFTEDGRFVAMYGQEFSSIGTGNHANVLDVDSVIETSEVPNGAWDLLLDTWLPAHLDSQNEPAILLLNHPNTGNSPDHREYGIDDFTDFPTWLSRLDAHAQLINIINGPSHGQPTPSAHSEDEFLRYLNLGLHVAPTADQDNHRENWGSAAETRTGVIAESLTKAAILNALRSRHVYATEDRNLEIIAPINGELVGTHFQGADVPDAGSELDISITLRDPDESFAFYTIDVYSDQVGGTNEADVIAQFTVQGDTTLSLDGITYDGGNQYIFFKVTQTDDDAVLFDHAWVAPVWFEAATTIPPSATAVLTLAVNEVLEEATITNVGVGDVNLLNWTLVSVRGDQRFTFSSDVVLSPGQSVVVTSGPNGRDDPPGFVLWTNDHMWRNAGDPGQLLDPNNTVRAETDN